MTQLTADATVLALLRQAEELAEVRDSQGNIVGFYTPVTSRYAKLYRGASGRLDPVEIQRRKLAKEKGFTTKEVFEHLLSLTQDPVLRADLQKKIAR